MKHQYPKHIRFTKKEDQEMRNYYNKVKSYINRFTNGVMFGLLFLLGFLIWSWLR